MSGHVPAEASVLLEPLGTPIAGNLEEIDASIAYTHEVCADSAQYRQYLRHAERTLRQLRSHTVSNITEVLITSVLPAAQALHDSAGAAGHALWNYQQRVRTIHTEATALSEQVNSHLDCIRSSWFTIEEISRHIHVHGSYLWHTAPPGQMPEPRLDQVYPEGLTVPQRQVTAQLLYARYETRWLYAAAAWYRALEHLDRCTVRWSALIDARQAAEHTLVRTLRHTKLGQLIRGGRHPKAAAVNASLASGIAGGAWQAETSRLSQQERQLKQLLDGSATPKEVAAVWEQWSEAGVNLHLLLRTYCVEFASLNGIPFWAMNVAGRETLRYALAQGHPEHLAEVYRRMGAGGPASQGTLDGFAAELNTVAEALHTAARQAGNGGIVQLLSLGVHDGSLTAGISMGSLDTAATVGVLVSGMNSNVHALTESFPAFTDIRDSDPRLALVTWIGYKSPNLLQEPRQHHADRGGRKFALFLDGVAASRQEHPITRLITIGHSYGTNVAAEALKFTHAPVNIFVTLGSSGLKPGTSLRSLGVEQIYAAQAAGDAWAPIGQHASWPLPIFKGFRVNPKDFPQAKAIPTEKTEEGEAVTMHPLHDPLDWGVLQWFADAADGTAADEEIGYLNPASSSAVELGKIVRNEQE